MTSNDELVACLQRQGTLRTPKVLEAFHAVDRRRFLGSEATEADAYMNSPVRCGFKTTVGGVSYAAETVHLSAPYIYARVAEAMELEPGMSFLNVGAGIGYFSSIIAHILGKTSAVHGIEIRADLCEAAQALADEFSATTPAARMTFVAGNAFHLNLGTNMLYDRIYVGGGVPNHTAQFFKRLVRPGGILMGPFSDELRKWVVPKPGEPEPRETRLMGVRFTPMEPAEDSGIAWANDGGDIVISAAVWAPKLNHFRDAKPSFRAAVTAIMMLDARPGPASFPRHLGTFMWHHIFSFCPRNWFDAEPSEVDRLRLELESERHARLALQEQLERVESERDQAMTLCSIMRSRLMQITRAQVRRNETEGLERVVPGDGAMHSESDASDSDEDRIF